MSERFETVRAKELGEIDDGIVFCCGSRFSPETAIVRLDGVAVGMVYRRGDGEYTGVALDDELSNAIGWVDRPTEAEAIRVLVYRLGRRL